jgi:GNAT superfamily N-acetyltransferase
MLEIRFANADDAEIVLRFIHALAEYEREPQAVRVTAETLRQQLASAQPPFECLLAYDDGVPVGFALYFHSYSTWRGQRGLWLEDLFVLPEARRRGVGRALLQRVAALAVERDCGRLEWSVLDWNQPAIDFYRSLGARLMDEWIICRVTDDALQSLAAVHPVAPIREG